MARRARAAGAKKDTTANIGHEANLWQMADALRNNMDAAEYKHVVLGLIFLKYITLVDDAMSAIERDNPTLKGVLPKDYARPGLDKQRRAIARELVATVRGNVTIDWTVRENVRARLRVLVKRILRKHGYPPDKQEKATQTVLEQAEVLSEMWAAA